MPGSTMEDVVLSRANYSELDRTDNNIKIRLNSTAVKITNTESEGTVLTTYVLNNKTHSVKSKKCILACYNSAIPYICPEIPETQKKSIIL